MDTLLKTLLKDFVRDIYCIIYSLCLRNTQIILFSRTCREWCVTRQRDPCFYYNPIQREFLHISHARTIPWPQHTITHVYSTQGDMAMMKMAINRKVVGYSPHWEHTARSTQQRRRKNSSENLGSWEGTWGGGETRGGGGMLLYNK